MLITLKVVATLYAAGTLAIAARQLFAMTKFDDLDWTYDRSDIWMGFVTMLILWPVFVAKPLHFRDWWRDPKAFSGGSRVAARFREDREFWNSPPPCSAVISFQQTGYPGPPETSGQCRFDAYEVEAELLRQDTFQNDLVQRWLEHRQQGVRTPTQVPEHLFTFRYLAAALLARGHGTITCPACARTFQAREVQADILRVVCPKGHILMVVETLCFHESA